MILQHTKQIPLRKHMTLSQEQINKEKELMAVEMPAERLRQKMSKKRWRELRESRRNK
jgi:hypothetical protein